MTRSFKQILGFDSKPEVWDLLWFVSLLGFAGTIAGFLGSLWWVFDLASHFRVQEFFFFALATLLFLFGKQKKKAAVSAVAMVINLVLILPLYSVASSSDSDGRVYRALLMNLDRSNQAHEKVLAYIKLVKPDFMILEEVTDAWAKSFEALRVDYPFSKIQVRPDNFGIALFSKMKPEDLEVRMIGVVRLPTLVARFKIKEKRLTIIGTHPPPPIGDDFAKYRNEQLRELARIASLEEEPVILMGDLNITSWSPFSRDLLEEGGLRDSRRGFGLQPTWPVGFLPLWIPIDHILVSDGVVIHDRFVGPDIGSDHFPVVVDFQFENHQARGL